MLNGIVFVKDELQINELYHETENGKKQQQQQVISKVPQLNNDIEFNYNNNNNKEQCLDNKVNEKESLDKDQKTKETETNMISETDKNPIQSNNNTHLTTTNTITHTNTSTKETMTKTTKHISWNQSSPSTNTEKNSVSNSSISNSSSSSSSSEQIKSNISLSSNDHNDSNNKNQLSVNIINNMKSLSKEQQQQQPSICKDLSNFNVDEKDKAVINLCNDDYNKLNIVEKASTTALLSLKHERETQYIVEKEEQIEKACVYIPNENDMSKEMISNFHYDENDENTMLLQKLSINNPFYRFCKHSTSMQELHTHTLMPIEKRFFSASQILYSGSLVIRHNTAAKKLQPTEIISDDSKLKDDNVIITNPFSIFHDEAESELELDAEALSLKRRLVRRPLLAGRPEQLLTTTIMNRFERQDFNNGFLRSEIGPKQRASKLLKNLMPRMWQKTQHPSTANVEAEIKKIKISYPSSIHSSLPTTSYLANLKAKTRQGLQRVRDKCRHWKHGATCTPTIRVLDKDASFRYISDSAHISSYEAHCSLTRKQSLLYKSYKSEFELSKNLHYLDAYLQQHFDQNLTDLRVGDSYKSHSVGRISARQYKQLRPLDNIASKLPSSKVGVIKSVRNNLAQSVADTPTESLSSSEYASVCRSDSHIVQNVDVENSFSPEASTTNSELVVMENTNNDGQIKTTTIKNLLPKLDPNYNNFNLNMNLMTEIESQTATQYNKKLLSMKISEKEGHALKSETDNIDSRLLVHNQNLADSYYYRAAKSFKRQQLQPYKDYEHSQNRRKHQGENKAFVQNKFNKIKYESYLEHFQRQQQQQQFEEYGNKRTEYEKKVYDDTYAENDLTTENINVPDKRGAGTKEKKLHYMLAGEYARDRIPSNSGNCVMKAKHHEWVVSDTLRTYQVSESCAADKGCFVLSNDNTDIQRTQFEQKDIECREEPHHQYKKKIKHDKESLVDMGISKKEVTLTPYSPLASMRKTIDIRSESSSSGSRRFFGDNEYDEENYYYDDDDDDDDGVFDEEEYDDDDDEIVAKSHYDSSNVSIIALDVANDDSDSDYDNNSTKRIRNDKQSLNLGVAKTKTKAVESNKRIDDDIDKISTRKAQTTLSHKFVGLTNRSRFVSLTEHYRLNDSYKRPIATIGGAGSSSLNSSTLSTTSSTSSTSASTTSQQQQQQQQKNYKYYIPSYNIEKQQSQHRKHKFNYHQPSSIPVQQSVGTTGDYFERFLMDTTDALLIQSSSSSSLVTQSAYITTKSTATTTTAANMQKPILGNEYKNAKMQRQQSKCHATEISTRTKAPAFISALNYYGNGAAVDSLYSHTYEHPTITAEAVPTTITASTTHTTTITTTTTTNNIQQYVTKGSGNNISSSAHERYQFAIKTAQTSRLQGRYILEYEC